MEWHEQRPVISIQGLGKTYAGCLQPALAPLTAAMPLGTITTVVGKSGCGKTTLLRLLARLEVPSMGDIEWPEGWAQTTMAMVFQEPRLLPWLTVRENIAFAQYGDHPVRANTVERLLQEMGLSSAAERLPAELSGGMAQRVAIGRALCADTPMLLMDEPFSALDYFTRRELQEELHRWQTQMEKTVLFVTHDVDEALLLGDSIICLRPDGKHKQIQNPVSWGKRRDTSCTEPLKRDILQHIGGLL